MDRYWEVEQLAKDLRIRDLKVRIQDLERQIRIPHPSAIEESYFPSSYGHWKMSRNDAIDKLSIAHKALALRRSVWEAYPAGKYPNMNLSNP